MKISSRRSPRARVLRERSASLFLQAGALPARRSDTDRGLILFYNSMFGEPIELPAGGMPEGFEASTDLRRFEEAEAVVFHIPSLGGIGRLHKRRGQIWVAWWMESDAHVPRLRDPGFMERFDLTMSYHRDADVFVSYLSWFGEAALRSRPGPKTETAALFMSGAAETSGREAYAAALMGDLEVHSFGRRLRNRRLAEDRGVVTKLETISRYRFTLAFENSIEPDYVTEKLYEPLVSGSVPVYLGAPNVAGFAPAPDCFINVRDFAGPAELADHLRELERDPAAYESLLAWKEEPFDPGFRQLLEQQGTHGLTKLCELISGP